MKKRLTARIAFALGLAAALLSAAGAVPPATAQAQRAPQGAALLKEPRIALVIGNAKYKDAPLRNPLNDARAFAASLREVGFDVIQLENAGQREMARAITRFGEKLADGGVGLFYFSGHGLQVRGRNFLVPVDAEIGSENSVRNEAIDVDQVLDQMGGSSTRLNLVILDACRNNPFERRFRGSSSGLASINAPKGTLIAYSTAPGSVAADGEGNNGVYTGALLKTMRQAGVRVEEVFKEVRAEVSRITNDAQVPWESSSLTGDFFFKPAPPPPPPAPQPAAAPVAQALAMTAPTPSPPPAVTIDPGELAFWDAIKQSTNAGDYQAYLEAFPNGRFAPLARNRIKMHAPPPTVASAPEPALEMEETSGDFVASRKLRLVDRPAANGKTVRTVEAGTPVTMQARTRGGGWAKIAVDGRTRGWVESDALKEAQAAEAEEWDRIREGRDTAALQGFLRRFPSGAFAADARTALAAIRDEQRRADEQRKVAAEQRRDEELQRKPADEQQREARRPQQPAPPGVVAAGDGTPSRETPQARLNRALEASYAPEDSGRITEIAKGLPEPMQFYLLGRLHETGNGLPLDLTAAQRYYRLAAARGYQRAQTDLTRLTATATRDSLAAGAGATTTAQPPQHAVIASADAFPALPAPAPAASATRSFEPAPPTTPAPRAAEPPASPESSGTTTVAPAAGFAASPTIALLQRVRPGGGEADSPGGGALGNALPSGSGADRYNHAMGLLRDGDYAAAEKAFRSFVRDFPNDGMAPNAQFWIGETYFLRGDYGSAAAAYGQAYRGYPTSSKAPDSLFKLAVALGNDGRRRDACGTLREFATTFPGALSSYGERLSHERHRLGC
jgi:tol-pal system protein YbgF